LGGLALGGFPFRGARLTPQPVAFAGDLDDLGVLEDAVEDGGGGRNVADQLAPVFQWAVGGHHRGADFVTPHDDLEQVLPAPLGQASTLCYISPIVLVFKGNSRW
jgi:hypothetical protein